jgi:hypothetical protein
VVSSVSRITEGVVTSAPFFFFFLGPGALSPLQAVSRERSRRLRIATGSTLR